MSSSSSSTSATTSPAQVGWTDVAEALKGQTIVVMAHQVNGLGDLSCSLKLANLMKDHMDDSVNIVVASNRPGECRSFNPGGRFRVVPEEEFATIQNVALAILAPGDNITLFGRYWILTPTLALDEYDARSANREYPQWVNKQKMGIGPESLGIFTTPELGAEMNTPQQRLAHLNDAFPNIWRMIAGEHSVEEFADSSRFYFGYANKRKTAEDYIAAIRQLNAGETKDLVIWMPKVPTFREVKRYKHGHHTVTVIPRKVSPQEFQAMLKASEPETVVTGDQSTGEAISCHDKRFVYEALPHKDGFADALTQAYRAALRTSRIYHPQRQSLSMVDSFQRQRACGEALHAVDRRICDEKTIEKNLPAAILETVRNFQAPEYTDLTLESEFLSQIPFNQKVLINQRQLEELEISVATGKSPHFSDSVFEWDDLGHKGTFFDGTNYYMIERKRSTS